MLYTDLDSLLAAAAQLDAQDTEGLKKLGEFLGVYFQALNNPPQFVIGVGAITYAQEMLIAYQLEKA